MGSSPFTAREEDQFLVQFHTHPFPAGPFKGYRGPGYYQGPSPGSDTAPRGGLGVIKNARGICVYNEYGAKTGRNRGVRSMKPICGFPALAVLSALTMVGGCISAASEQEAMMLPIYSSEMTDEEYFAKLNRIRSEEKAKTAQFCKTEELENSAREAVAADFPDKDLEGKLTFIYEVLSDAIAVTVFEIHDDNHHSQVALRIAVFSSDNCQLQSVLIPQ